MSSKLNSTSSFQSSSLNQVFSEVSGVFESHQETLDGVSQDIKSLEHYLRSKGVLLSFSFLIENPKGLEPNDCSLSWERAENGDMRLFFQEESFDDLAQNVAMMDYAEIGVAYLPKREDFVKLIGAKKPLIEAPSAVRLSIASFLGDFLGALAERLKVAKRVWPEQTLVENFEY